MLSPIVSCFLKVRKFVPALVAVASLNTMVAAPIINQFSSTANLTVYGNSVSFDNNGGSGPLAITVLETSPGIWGQFGGKGIFTWSQWLSLDLDQGQFLFSLSGAESIGTQDARISLAFNIGGVGTVSSGPITLTDGKASFNVYEAASQQFYGGGAVALGRSYQAQIYIEPMTGINGQGIVYSLGSIAAVPEPGAVLLLGMGGMITLFSNRRRRASRKN